MSITFTGFILIVLGVYSFFFNKKFLYNLNIFFIPFSATAIINIGVDENASGIQPFFFLGSLWIISFIIDSSKFSHKNFSINKSELLSIIQLLSFGIIAFISLIMPLIINGKEYGNVTGQLDSNDRIVFSFRNITQYIYLLHGIIFAICIYSHNKKISNYINTIKVFANSIIFVIFWGCLELFCNITNLTYPAIIFNNSNSPSAGGYGGVLSEGGIKRISSVAVEPSILTQTLIIILPFLVFAVIYKQYIYGKLLDLIYIFTLIFFIIRSTSASGIASLAVSLIISSIIYLSSANLKQKLLFFLYTIIAIPIIYGVVIYFFNDIIVQALFNKSDSYSSLERLSATLEAWSGFLQHPLLGLGWGSVTSFDLFIKILSNTGILGFLAFFIFLINLLFRRIKSNANKTQVSWIISATTVAFFTLILNNMTSGFSFVFGFFWLVTGLALINIIHLHD